MSDWVCPSLARLSHTIIPYYQPCIAALKCMIASRFRANVRRNSFTFPRYAFSAPRSNAFLFDVGSIGNTWRFRLRFTCLPVSMFGQPSIISQTLQIHFSPGAADAHGIARQGKIFVANIPMRTLMKHCQGMQAILHHVMQIT